MRFGFLVLSICFLLFHYSCDDDISSISSQVIPSDVISAEKVDIDVVAHSFSNNDTIRADQRTLSIIPLGVFHEPIFGTTIANYATQVRLPFNNLNFGTNPQFDSIILSISPQILTAANLVTTTRTQLVDAPEDKDDVYMEVSRYPIANRYGRSGVPMQLNVYEVSSFLPFNQMYFSNHPISKFSTVLGSTQIKDYVEGIQIKNGNNLILREVKPEIRIHLDKTFFINKILNKVGQAELSDDAQFISYFRGLYLEIASNDGFIFNFQPGQINLSIHYSHEITTGTPPTTSTRRSTINMPLSGPFNTRVGIFEHIRSNASPAYNVAVSSPNTTQGEAKLYAQGMGGASIRLKLNSSQINQLRTRYANEKLAVVGAKIRLYFDEDMATLPRVPSKVYIINSTDNKVLDDHSAYQFNPLWELNPAYNEVSNPGYLDLNITKHIKNIIEKNQPINEFTIHMGDFIPGLNRTVNIHLNNRAFNPFRGVFIGNNTSSDKKLKLQVFLTKTN